ncbi:O-antigen ligase family protein [Capillimicrobium parvum]|uniref:O-antigen ligase-related domain-containing protein n=1 Tax=Capillimicrobium parvum TaxID=2884022 RepID=A0A9E6Y268_9ACTN|nr:O-antigen ligase family protein [Capillimicrobium parvum]UGS38829.1 hypothetical protein DSM104329_05259 [Capillimicrobium parvum]
MFVIVLLLLATVYHGAFYLRDWGPPAVLVLGTLLALQIAGGGLPLGGRWTKVMLAGIWGFAAWALLSALWSTSPSAAWEGGARDLFYAALVTVPIVLVPRGRVIEVLGLGLVAGIAALALLTLVRMLIGDDGLFLAGRLDAPVGYRNATALLFALGVWPLLALAARGEKRAFRAAAFSLAVLCLALAFLTQSRGIVIGLGVGAVVALGLGPERIRRAWLGVLAVVLIAIFSSGLLTPYNAFDGGQGVVQDGDISRAAWTTLLLMVVAFGVGLAIALVDNGLRTGSEGIRVARLAARAGLVLIVIVGIVGGLMVVGNPVSEARQKWDEFTANETIATGATRYANVSGQRYDLWRVSLNAFADNPITGVGEASYPFEYYGHRNNDRNLDDPHGLPFQVLSELGLVGAILMGAFLVGAIGVLVTRWRHVPQPRQRLASGLAASGAVLIGQSMVDWMWRIPGVTGLGLLCLGIGVALVLDPATAPSRRLPAAWRAVTAGALAIAVVAVAVLYLSDFYVRQARADAADSPAKQLSAARTASKLNPVSVVPWYLMASAHESDGQLAEARSDLLKALDKEPGNFATMGVIGDFYARQGRYRAARYWYGRALKLNPVDVGLQQLAKTGGDPKATG